MSADGGSKNTSGIRKDDRPNDCAANDGVSSGGALNDKDGAAAGRNDSVRMEILLSHALLPVGEPGVFWALVTLTGLSPNAKEAVHGGGGRARLPLNIGLVLDRSGSMSGEPLEYVKEAACFVVDQLSARDKFSLVTFDSDVELLCPSQEVQFKDQLKAAIRNIQSGSSTNLSGGLLRGYEEVLKENRAGQVNRVVLLTDGMANVGVTDPTLLGAKVRAIEKKGISVSAVGVGSAFDEDLLIALAEAGHGNFYYVKNIDEIPSVFRQELTGLLSVVAQAVKVKATVGFGWKLAGVLGYEPEPAPDGAVLHLPDMYEDEVKRLVLEVWHPPLPEGEHEVLEVSLKYVDAGQALAEVSVSVKARLSAGYGPPEAYKPRYEVVKRVELVKTALAKDKAVEKSREGELNESKAILQDRLQALENLTRDGHGAGDAEVKEEIENLRNLVRQVDEIEEERKRLKTRGTHASLSDNAAPTPSQATFLKELRSQSYMTRRDRREPNTRGE